MKILVHSFPSNIYAASHGKGHKNSCFFICFLLALAMLLNRFIESKQIHLLGCWICSQTWVMHGVCRPPSYSGESAADAVRHWPFGAPHSSRVVQVLQSCRIQKHIQNAFDTHWNRWRNIEIIKSKSEHLRHDQNLHFKWAAQVDFRAPDPISSGCIPNVCNPMHPCWCHTRRILRAHNTCSDVIGSQ